MSAAPLNSLRIKALAARLGFVGCGLARAEPVAEHFATHFRRWLEMDYCAEMDYMRRNVELRLHPELLVPGVRTIVSLAMNFMPSRQQPAISLYAQGRDYHDVMRCRMVRLMDELKLEGRCFVDTAPVMERYWAWRSGVGVFTEGGFISVSGYGPTVFLGELFLMQEADAYSPLPSFHGEQTCPQTLPSRTDKGEEGTRNVKAFCPALTPDGLDARRCISYQTIEHRGPLPDGLRLTSTFFGCDRCLRAAHQFAESHPTDEPDFQPSDALLGMTRRDWPCLTEEQYRTLFKGSAVKRAKYDGLMRNIRRWQESETLR